LEYAVIKILINIDASSHRTDNCFLIERNIALYDLDVNDQSIVPPQWVELYKASMKYKE